MAKAAAGMVERDRLLSKTGSDCSDVCVVGRAVFRDPNDTFWTFRFDIRSGPNVSSVENRRVSLTLDVTTHDENPDFRSHNLFCVVDDASIETLREIHKALGDAIQRASLIWEEGR